MSIVLRQATASQEVPLGPFLDSTDGNTEETGLTIANTDILLWKAGATTLTAKNSGGATHISNGIYYAVFDAVDSSTAGAMKIFVHVAGALAFSVSCIVYPATIYDALIAASANLTSELSTAAVTAVWSKDVTAITTADTAAENLNVINDMLTGKMTNVGTTITHYKQDGTTVRKTFTKDSATAPTSRVPT